MPVKRKMFVVAAAPIPPKEEQRLLRIPQAAHYLNRSVWMIRQMIASGELHIVGTRKPFVIDRNELDAYIENAKTLKAA
jgi:excisionase family DNA binding protein